MEKSDPYRLDEQVGYILRRVTQRHLAIFSDAIPQVTTTQFAVLARLSELGPQSQNQLGRETSMDAATIKGVVDRLSRQGLVVITPDPEDKRRLTVGLSEAGKTLFSETRAAASAVSVKTLEPLTQDERVSLLRLLSKLC
ncbi:MarR family winged helix-turn-helix transcriptional regulator [Thioclava sp. FR2]|uniref:MarR family winged helix-turn-helix transcriptional regulator n=1 Tax=Thioclava sp. FR2 TaxID=3445780 RepID=UPI003EBB9851